MITAANVIATPPIASSVSVPTEQVARDNRVREKVVPTTQSAESPTDKPLSGNEKRLRQPGWEPSEHPDYELELDSGSRAQTEYERLVDVLSAGSYLSENPAGYTMRLRLPQEVLDQLSQFGQTARTRGVIQYHYATSILPNPAIEYLVVV